MSVRPTRYVRPHPLSVSMTIKPINVENKQNKFYMTRKYVLLLYVCILTQPNGIEASLAVAVIHIVYVPRVSTNHPER